MHSKIVNKTRYDDLENQINKLVSSYKKNLEGNLPNKQSTTVKRNSRPSTKHLCLNSTISIDELTVETFYHFKTSELFNI